MKTHIYGNAGTRALTACGNRSDHGSVVEDKGLLTLMLLVRIIDESRLYSL